jgi:hypothetical protein
MYILFAFETLQDKGRCIGGGTSGNRNNFPRILKERVLTIPTKENMKIRIYFSFKIIMPFMNILRGLNHHGGYVNTFDLRSECYFVVNGYIHIIP